VIINRNDLIAPWSNKKLPKNFIASDKDYFIPTESLVQDTIYPKFLIWLKALNLNKWEHKWDCDNFADAFKLFACGYYEQNIDSEAEGIAVGVVNYMAELRAEDGSKGGHAANIFYIENAGGIVNVDFKFIEPQNGRIYTPSQQEFDSIWTIYI